MTRFYGVVYGLILLAAIIFGWVAWQDSRQATVLVEWSTASELDTVGYNLQRSESLEGPFVQVNAALIPASSDPLTGGDYSYEDRNTEPGKTYYYRLEEVEMDGRSENFGPISVDAGSSPALGLYLSLGVIILGLAGGVWILYRQRMTPQAEEQNSTQDSGA